MMSLYKVTLIGDGFLVSYFDVGDGLVSDGDVLTTKGTPLGEVSGRLNEFYFFEGARDFVV